MRAFQEILQTSGVILFVVLLLPAAAGAQGILTAEAADIECLPVEDNGVGWANVRNNVPDTTVRLNFRRMNDAVEDLYYVLMRPAGAGRYWGVFPKTEDRQLDRHDLIETREEVQGEYRWAAWWREKQASDHRDPNDPRDEADLDDDLIRERASLGRQVPREWLAEMDDPTFQRWLEQLENEPTEYFVSVHDAEGGQLARSMTKVTEVRRNCRVELSQQERGEAENLTVGETAHWQRGEEVFHWLCPGVVTRIDPMNILRGDGVCRACVIAWWQMKPLLLIGGSTLAGITAGAILIAEDQPPASPVSP